MDLSKELDIAICASIQAGEKILEIYNDTIEVEYKEDKSPLTKADKAGNEIIVEALKRNFPNYSILSEESRDDKSRLENDWCWIVDPLDGTKEFIKRNGEFTVNIALAHKQKTVLGVIYVPVKDELYYATKNNGAYLMGEANKNYKIKQNHQLLKVSDRIKSNLRLVKSRSHASDKLKELIQNNNEKISETKSAGSSLKGCLIAKRDAEIYYRFGPTMEWDTAAMQCVVEEAGGIFKQMDNTEMLYNRENSLNDKGFYILNNIENKLSK